MNKLYVKHEQSQNDISLNTTLDHQSLDGDSLFAESHHKVMKCELQQWDIKPDLCLPLKQDLTPGLSLKSELPTSTLNLLSQHDQHEEDDKTLVSTQHQKYPADVVMAFSKEYQNGL